MNETRKKRLVDLGVEALADALLELANYDHAADDLVERMIATPKENIYRFKSKLAGILRSQRFVSGKESAGFARELEALLQDLKAGVDDPQTGAELVVSFYETDKAALGNCDDSDGNVVDVYRYDAKELFVNYARRCPDKDRLANLVFKLNRDDDYGVRDTLIDCAAEYLPEPNIRTLINKLQKAADKQSDDYKKRHWLHLIDSMARQIKDVQVIIRRRQLIPDEPPIHLEDRPWPLKIYTLGRFALVRDGKTLEFTGKAQEKPLALLKALIAFGGQEVRGEQVADALWPESDGDLSHKSLATTLWRLRKLTGHPEAIVLSEGKLELDPKYCWVDVRVFERMMREAESAWHQGRKKNDMTGAVSLIEKAIDFYRGPFLPAETHSDWTISLRERLQSKFLRALKRLCKYWNETGQHEKAVECYQRALEVDDLDEEVYQALMSCYLQLDLRAAALSLYERCKKRLSAKFGIEPSKKIETLCSAILSKSKTKT
jgi:DNA-binding SARP family transcriptional activator